ncbi:MAG TPA: phospholipid carrier-dependent glycosyltransferase [Corynebacteriales bacterium]|nr:phospholipid carrier-dependent glycosyltransferase [Mycobacteriales bacterium]
MRIPRLSPRVDTPRRIGRAVKDQVVAAGEVWPRRPQATDTIRGWYVTAFLAILGFFTRFIGLKDATDVGTPVFDEKHYVPQAWQMLFNQGVEDNPGYGLVVHPPLGKQIIALSEALFGYNPLGWRAASALAGVICIILVVRITRRLTGSTYAAALAGLLMVCEGMFTVVSRTGLLDIFLITFVLGALLSLLKDKDQVEDRMLVTLREGRTYISPFGPRWGFRWWRFTAGILLGLSIAVKWSGLYFVAVFGVLSVMWDVALRRRYRVSRPWVGTIRRDLLPALGSLAALPLLVYFSSWWAWLRSETGVYRHVVGNEVPAEGFFSWVPSPFRALWYYHQQMLEFHSSLTTSAGYEHPWESKPWDWLINLKPLLYFFEATPQGTCGPDGCVQAILLLGTSMIWWAGVFMLMWALWKVFRHHDPRYVVVLSGYAAAWIPWLLTWDRQMYFFYASAIVPFLCMGLGMALAELDGWVPATPPASANRFRKWFARWGQDLRLGRVIVSVYMGLVVANFVWILPIVLGTPITPGLWKYQHWLPTW